MRARRDRSRRHGHANGLHFRLWRHGPLIRHPRCHHLFRHASDAWLRVERATTDGRRRDPVIAVLLSERLHLHVERDLVFRLDYLRERDEPVHKLLSHHLLDDSLLVVVPQRSAQFVVVHVLFVLADAPQARHFLRVQQFELAVVVRPLDDVTVLVAKQQLEQELPQRDVRFDSCAKRQNTTLEQTTQRLAWAKRTSSRMYLIYEKKRSFRFQRR